MSTQQALATQDKTAKDVAVVEATFNLPALVSPDEAKEVMQENLAELGGNLNFPRVKIPSGGGLSFEVINEQGEAEPTAELQGIVLDFYPINAWWAEKFTGENNAPDCFSMDGKTGCGNQEKGIPEGQICARCPKNQWGSDPEGGKGKACKNMFRVYLLQEESVFPVLLTLPPTSRRNWENYVQRLTNKLKSYYSVVTAVKLEKDKNVGGITYSKAAFFKSTDLTREEKAALKAYATAMKPSMRAVAIEDQEYNVEETADNGAGASQAEAPASQAQPY